MSAYQQRSKGIVALIVLGFAACANAGYEPWGPLVDDSWIYFGSPQTRLTIHSVNDGDYEVGFDQRRSDGAARGLNSLVFSYGGQSTGHLESSNLVDSFSVVNTGDNRTFSGLLLLTAIEADKLPANFSMSLGLQGGTPHKFDPLTDFAYYDPAGYDAGRPSGYYSQTSPSRDEISYSFDRGIVTVFALDEVELGPLGGMATIDYAFENLAGTAVFSVYGLDDNIGWIYHTNRSLIDNNRPTAPISTFEVVPEPGILTLLVAGSMLIARRRFIGSCGR